jgi:hypothetical protein
MNILPLKLVGSQALIQDRDGVLACKKCDHEVLSTKG